MNEDLEQLKTPVYPRVSAQKHARSADGVIVGITAPGFVQWEFDSRGPLPSVIQPYFIPGGNSPSALKLIIRKGAGTQSVTLSENLPLRYRAIDFSRHLKDATAYTLRFEGKNALLKGVRFYQPVSADIPAGSLLTGISCLALCVFFAARVKNYSASAICVVTLAGLMLRWAVFCDYYSVPLEGDAPGYWSLARCLNWAQPFSTSYREPVFMWFLKSAGFLLGNSERSARFLTLIFSCALIPLTYLLGVTLKWPKTAAILAAALIAANPFSIFMSVQGLQLELFTALILLFSILWLKGLPLGSGIAGAALSLTRIQSVAAVVPLGILSAWKSRHDWRKIMLFFLPIAALVIPHLFTVRKNTGSFTGNLDHAARYYSAAERTGDPGKVGKFSGITLKKYLFSNGTPIRTAGRLAGGYAQILLNPFNPFNRIFLNSHYSRMWNLLLLPFFWYGLILCLLEKEGRNFLLLPLFFLSALPMLQDQFREPRLLFHAAPFFSLACARGAHYASALYQKKQSLFRG